MIKTGGDFKSPLFFCALRPAPRKNRGCDLSHPRFVLLGVVEPRLFYLAVTVTPAVSNQLALAPLKARTV